MSSGSTKQQDDAPRWVARPYLARSARTVFVLTPFAASGLSAFAMAKAAPPAAIGVHAVLWFALVACLSTAVLMACERVLRRFAPISVLLSMSLVFPDEAPNRYRMALKTGSTRSLARRIDEIRASGCALDDEQSYAEQMLELLALLSAHDRLTRGHCERVRAYTDLLIDELRITGDDAGRLRWAALLHDLGKLMVPGEILNKPGRPTDE
ncbi:MAG: HD domain-containing protein, partial [Actinomycetota bacterium]